MQWDGERRRECSDLPHLNYYKHHRRCYNYPTADAKPVIQPQISKVSSGRVGPKDGSGTGPGHIGFVKRQCTAARCRGQRPDVVAIYPEELSKTEMRAVHAKAPRHYPRLAAMGLTAVLALSGVTAAVVGVVHQQRAPTDRSWSLPRTMSAVIERTSFRRNSFTAIPITPRQAHHVWRPN